MATFDTHGDGRWSPTDWPGGGEGAPADDRVAGGQSTPDEVVRLTSEVISQWLSGSASDLEALRGVFDANRSGSLIDDDDDDDDDDETDGADDSDGGLPAGKADLSNGISGDDRAADMPGQEMNTRDNLGVASIDVPEHGPLQSFVDGLRMQPGSGGIRTDGTTEIAGQRSLADNTETAGGGSPQGDVREAPGCDSLDLDAILAAFIEWAGRFRGIGLELRDGMPADPAAHSETSGQSRGQVDVTIDTRSSVPDVALVPWHHQDDFRFI